MTSRAAATAATRRYHHGDLRNALIRAGFELAREGGPPAIVLRAAARRVGVSANAAYRHFEDLSALVDAVSLDARSALGRSMRDELDRVRPTGDPRRDALGILHVGARAYVRFALNEPGLYASAFLSGMPELPTDGDPDAPEIMLDRALDALVTVGLMAPETRPLAFIHMWAGSHGLSSLLPGPLADMPTEDRDAAIETHLSLMRRALLIDPANDRQPPPTALSDS